MRVYKGFETPCRIHGYRAGDFFLFCTVAVLLALLAIMLLNSAVRSGAWEMFVIFVPLGLLALFCLHLVFLSRARRRRYSNKGDSSDICTCNFQIRL